MPLGLDGAVPHLRWAEEQVGSRVVEAWRLVGGMSSTVVGCRFAEADPAVLRIIDNAEWLQREPYLIDQEAEGLRLLESSPVNAPRLIAASAGGVGGDGVGRLLMSWLDGAMIVDADHLRSRVEVLAEVAADIAATPLPFAHGLLPWRSWVGAAVTPPKWGDRELWAEAIARHRAGSRPVWPEPVLLHRDFHPLNVLWPAPDGAEGDPDNPVDGRARPSVVDWVNACVGHPHAELAHCRWNLAVTVDLDAADAFLARYLTRTEASYGLYDPWWDLDSILDKVAGPFGTEGWQAVGRTDIDQPAVITATETLLRSVLEG